jgi:hypothetical protein
MGFQPMLVICKTNSSGIEEQNHSRPPIASTGWKPEVSGIPPAVTLASF